MGLVLVPIISSLMVDMVWVVWVVVAAAAVVVGVVTWQSRNDPPFQASYILLSVSAVASQLVPSYNTKSPR